MYNGFKFPLEINDYNRTYFEDNYCLSFADSPHTYDFVVGRAGQGRLHLLSDHFKQSKKSFDRRLY